MLKGDTWTASSASGCLPAAMRLSSPLLIATTLRRQNQGSSTRPAELLWGQGGSRQESWLFPAGHPASTTLPPPAGGRQARLRLRFHVRDIGLTAGPE